MAEFLVCAQNCSLLKKELFCADLIMSKITFSLTSKDEPQSPNNKATSDNRTVQYNPVPFSTLRSLLFLQSGRRPVPPRLQAMAAHRSYLRPVFFGPVTEEVPQGSARHDAERDQDKERTALHQQPHGVA